MKQSNDVICPHFAFIIGASSNDWVHISITYAPIRKLYIWHHVFMVCHAILFCILQIQWTVTAHAQALFFCFFVSSRSNIEIWLNFTTLLANKPFMNKILNGNAFEARNLVQCECEANNFNNSQWKWFSILFEKQLTQEFNVTWKSIKIINFTNKLKGKCLVNIEKIK